VSVVGELKHDVERSALWVRLPGRFNVEELRGLLAEVEAAMQEHRPRLLIRDATAVSPTTISPLHRRVAADHFRKLSEERIGPDRELLVLPHPLLRGAVTAVSWIFAPAWHRDIVVDRETAEALVATVSATTLPTDVG
jgi:hypothetical protein